MDDQIKNAIRSLVTCEHPIESQWQVVGGGNTLQWCSICGAARFLGGPAPQWRRHSCSLIINELLVNQALQSGKNS